MLKMAAKAKGLGRGLDSLIPAMDTKPAKKKDAETLDKGPETLVKITKVEPNREQPRKNFDEDALQELADSIKQFGVLQPLLVQEKKSCVFIYIFRIIMPPAYMPPCLYE